jgi:hypothetical protein
MIKTLTKFFLSLLILLLIAVFYLSFFGINTKTFNNLIQKKVRNIDENLKIELDSVKILLDIKNFSLNIKTANPYLVYNSKKFELKNIKTNLSIGSFFNKEFSIDDLEISIKDTKLKHIISLYRFFKNTPESFILEKIIKQGSITANIDLNFDSNGKIKDDYIIIGEIKNAQLRLLNKNFIKNLNFNFDLKKKNYKVNNISVDYNKLKIFSEIINIKNKDNSFLLNGKFITQENNLNTDALNIIFDNYFKDKNISNINFDSNNEFSFNINKKFKISKINLDSKIRLNKLNYQLSSKNLKKYLPEYNENLELNNHIINLSYNNKKISLSGKGNFLIGTKSDVIEYKVTNKNDNYEFTSKIKINNNPFKIDFLKYKKKENIDLMIEFSGNYKKDKKVYFNKILFKENNNKIFITGLDLNKNFKFKKIDTIQLNFINSDKKKNHLELKRYKKNYLIKGKVFDADYLIDKILISDEKSSFSDILDNFNSKIEISINKVFLNNISFINNLTGSFFYKENKLYNGQIKSKFSNDKKIQLTINTNEKDEKITTFFSEYAKPFVKRYKFVKGFEDGSLDFYSIKKNDKSESQLKIYNFKLNELPALTKILTLASLQGIADILTGEGIRFDELEMIFSNNDNVMNIDEMYAIGPAISILLDGYVENKKLISLRGTLVPATTVNKFIGSIPILGNILVGKKTGEGVFGVSFKIKGPPKKTKTTVNPIKTLTPRFITRTLEKIKKN